MFNFNKFKHIKEAFIKGFKILKSYYQIIKVKPIFLLIEFIFLIVPSILSIISPVLTANIISSITVYDFAAGKKYLIYDFLIIIISAISYFGYHLISNKVNKTIITNLQNFVYLNVRKNKKINKISLAVLNDIYESTNFNKNLLYKACFLIKSIILIFIIIKYNLIIALAIIAVSIVSFLLLSLTDKKIQRHNYIFSNYQNQSLELFNSIQQGVEAEQNESMSIILKDKYFNLVDKSIATTNKTSLLYGINNNFISLILKSTIFIATLFLINQIKLTTLTLSLYLILTPYLTSSAQNLIAFFEVFSEFGTIENCLLNFEALKFQTQENKPEQIEVSTFNLYFFEISTNDKMFPKLKNLNLKLNFNEINLIVGESDSGTETIFALLLKKIKTSSGSIFIDNKNIDAIAPEKYSSIASFTNTTPYFYNISIIENLYLVCQNKSKILKTINEWNLKHEINKLNEKLNTVITQTTNPKIIYFLGILKCYLSGAKIICVNNIPTNLNREEKFLLENIFVKLKKETLLILLSNNDDYSRISDKIIYLEKGNINNLISK